MNIERLLQNIQTVRERIAEAARRSGRKKENVRLVAVTKKSPVEWIRAIIDLGERDLGENYPQELWEKVASIDNSNVRWHLIGHLQGNKAKKTMPLVRMIHAVDSLKLLESLNTLASQMPDPPPVSLQVNCSGETAKHGWSPEEVLKDATRIAACRSIPIVGLMTMAALGSDSETARPAFCKLREIRDRLQIQYGLALPELSMGMSGDFEAAIEEGASLVRIGSALFEGVET